MRKTDKDVLNRLWGGDSPPQSFDNQKHCEKSSGHAPAAGPQPDASEFRDKLLDVKPAKRKNKQQAAKQTRPTIKTETSSPPPAKERRKKTTEPVYDAKRDNKPVDYQALDREASEAAILETRRTRRREAVMARIRVVIMVILILLSAYMIFMIYGLFQTEYIYDDSGAIVPQVMSVSQIRALKNYNEMQSYYLQARSAYEEILVLDYRVSAGYEQPVLIGPEYLALVDKLNELYIQTQGFEPSTEYAQLQGMLLYWIQTDAAPYCGNLSQAIALNDANAASYAQELRINLYNDFSTITANLATMCDTVYGADSDIIITWSPESFIREHIGDLNYGD